MSTSWTARLRSRTLEAVPAEQALPDHQPAYVASWVYVFGVAALSAFLMILLTGTVLVVAGPTWWHTSVAGHLVNSVHLWSVELLFLFMVLHLFGKFFMAAWRGRRVLTWVTGALSMVMATAAALTGYLVQTNFDSQFIASEAKDGINAVGMGGVMNLMDTGQMLLWHVMLMPLAAGLLVLLHVVLVRLRGVVQPYGVAPDGSSDARPAGVR